jgi:hypothetical protein
LNPDLDVLAPPSTNLTAASYMSDGASLQNILSDVSLDHDECQRIFELRLHQLFDFATAKELHIPLDLIPSSLLEGPRDTPSTRLASTTNVDCSSMRLSHELIPATLQISFYDRTLDISLPFRV